MKHYIQLVGFDGKNYWRLFYVEVMDAKEIYYGLISKKHNLSFSKHGSGQVNVKVGSEKRRLDEVWPGYNSKPLSDLKDLESFGVFCPVPEQKISEEEYKKYVSRNCNGLFLIDLRNFDGTINFEPAIVNPEYKDSIMRRQWSHECQVYIYTASNPWVVFYTRNVRPKKE